MSENLRATGKAESALNVFLTNEFWDGVPVWLRQPKWPLFLQHSAAQVGGARRDRTDDLLLAKQALSQLSYGPAPVGADKSILTGLPNRSSRGIRPPSPFRATAWQPSLRCASEGWWAWEDLNFRPHAYQARALTN